MSIKFPQYALTISVKQRPNFYSYSSDSKICALSPTLPWYVKWYQTVSRTGDNHGHKSQFTSIQVILKVPTTLRSDREGVGSLE